MEPAGGNAVVANSTPVTKAAAGDRLAGADQERPLLPSAATDRGAAYRGLPERWAQQACRHRFQTGKCGSVEINAMSRRLKED